MEAYLWRDFMPGPETSTEGSGLIASVTVSAVDSLDLPEGADLKRLWVFLGGEVWQTEFSEVAVVSEPHSIQRVARGGPRWKPGSVVDVVTQLEIPNHPPVYLHVRVEIQATF